MKKSSKSADDLADLDKLKFSIIRKKTDLSKSAILRDRDTYVPELHRRADEAKASLREKEQSLLRSQKAEETINKRLARLKKT